MAWRNQGITGSNKTPLGNRRRFGGDETPDGSDHTPAPEVVSKRGRSPIRGTYSAMRYPTTS
jgi:splicing factor 1